VDKLILQELFSHAVSVGGKRGLPLSGFYKPWVYFLSRFAPWSVLAFVGVWRAWKQPAVHDAERAFERFLSCWLIGGLLLFSFASHQRGDLVYPLIPPGAWLAGREIGRLLRGTGDRTVGIASVLVAASVFTAIAINDRQMVGRKGDSARSAAVEQIAAEIRSEIGTEADMAHVDTPFALQFHLGTVQTPVSMAQAASILRNSPSARIAVVDLRGLRKEAGKNTSVQVVGQWPLPDGGAIHVVTGTAP